MKNMIRCVVAATCLLAIPGNDAVAKQTDKPQSTAQKQHQSTGTAGANSQEAGRQNKTPKYASDSVVYKVVDDRELRLFVTKPTDWKPTDRRPAVVFFHGGGWVGGSPGQFDEHCKHLTGRGMVTVQVEYRLLDRNDKQQTPSRCIEDAKSAIRWVRSHADQLAIDPDRIASGGGSAGGHLAAFLGTTDGTDSPDDDTTVSARSNAMLLFNPVYDNGPGGWGTGRVGDRYREFSPAHNISRDDAPAVVFLGTNDKLIPVATAQRFQANMQAAGIRSELHLYEGAGHGFFNFGRDENKWFRLTINEMDRFLIELGWLDADSQLPN